MWEYYYPDELYHHGRKGMKWGQNIFAKRRQKKINKVRRKNLEKAREAKATKAEEAAKRQRDLDKGRISPKKMTDQELQGQINRLQAEQRYKQLVMETRPVKRLMSKTWSDAIVPAVTEAGKEVVKKALIKKGSDLLGLDAKAVKSEYDKVKEAAEMAKFKEQKFNSERNLAEAQKKYKEYLNQKADAQKQVDEYNAKQEENYQRSRVSEPYHMKGAGGSSKNSTDNVSDGKASSSKNYPSVINNSSTAMSPMNSSSTKKAADQGEKWVSRIADVIDSDGNVLRSTTVNIHEED